jgi:hypothetical protein
MHVPRSGAWPTDGRIVRSAARWRSANQQLRSRFEWLREPDPAAVASPPLLMAFDQLYQDRRDLIRTGAP